VGLVLGGALFWLVYFDLKDRLQPEPRRRLVAAFLWGMGSAVVALGLYAVAAWLGFPEDPGVSAGDLFRYCFGLIGPVEEGAKFLVAVLVVFRWKEFDEPVDGLIYAAVLAIGFATFENFLYLPHLSWPEQIARALAAPVSHALLAVVWGFGVSRARFHAASPVARFLWPTGALLAAMALHGFYDFVILAWHATYLSAGVALLLWFGFIRQARRLVAEAVLP